MHGRILSAALGALALAAPVQAHDVSVIAVYGSVPTASWDARSKTWTLDLAGMVKCDGATRVDGALSAEGPSFGVVSFEHVAPGRVLTVTRGGMEPGDYRLTWPAAACSDDSFSENDHEGEHVASYENAPLHDFTLPDCDDPAELYTTRRVIPRPLIPRDLTVPPNGPIACPPPPAPEPCAASRRALVPAPLLPAMGWGALNVKPCEHPAEPEQPSIDAKCLGQARAVAAGATRSPIVPAPPGSAPPPPLPKSNAAECWAELELRAERARQQPCGKSRAVVPGPLLPVPCVPDPVVDAVGYTAAIQRVRRVRMRIARGTSETIVLRLNKRQMRKATRPKTSVRLILTVRDRSGRIRTSRSALYTL